MKNSLPFDIETLVLQITSRCPHNCPQCYMNRSDKDLPLDVAKMYIDLAFEKGARMVQMTGGEPFVYPYLSELIEYISSKRMYSVLATSGYGHSVGLYNGLKKKGMDVVCVSLNDILESENLKTRSMFGESLSAVGDLNACGIPCFCNLVLTDENSTRLEEIGIYLKKLGVAGICVLRPVPSFDGRYKPILTEKALSALNHVINTQNGFWRVENCFREYWEFVSGKSFSCPDIGSRTLFVNVDGTVSPCSKNAKYCYATIDEMMNDHNSWKGGCRNE